jgi:hypothetical protein
MYRFYRKHYAGARSAVLSAAVYGAIAAKLALSIARNAFRDSNGARPRGRLAPVATRTSHLKRRQ